MSTTYPPTHAQLVAGTVSPVWARLRLTLFALSLATVLAIVATGVRPASFTELAKAIGDGRVGQVTVLQALAADQVGATTAEVRWHDGFLPRWTPVRHTREGAPDAPDTLWTFDDRELEVIRGDIATHLARYAPGPVEVTVHDVSTAPPTRHEVGGWVVPGWVVALALTSFAGVIGLLLSAPEPVLATRWAWFWAFLSPVGFLALPAFLLWGVPPTGASERPWSRSGRLTGGWAFLIFCVLMSPAAVGL